MTPPEREALCDEIIAILREAMRSEFPSGAPWRFSTWRYAMLYVDRAKDPAYLETLRQINATRGLPPATAADYPIDVPLV